MPMRTSRNSRTSLCEKCRSRIHFEDFGVRAGPTSLPGAHKVPTRGRWPMRPLVEGSSPPRASRVRLAPNFLPSSASMGSGLPAGNSPRTMDDPSFCTSDWVRLMLPDMRLPRFTRYPDRADTHMCGLLLIRLFARGDLFAIGRRDRRCLVQDSTARRAYGRAGPVVRLRQALTPLLGDAQLLEDRHAQRLRLGARDAARVRERHVERAPGCAPGAGSAPGCGPRGGWPLPRRA